MMTEKEVQKLNSKYKVASPQEIVQVALKKATSPIVTTNFRPYEASILFVCSQVNPDIPVVWCDSGYNTDATYRHAEQLISELDLNIHLYVPKQTVAHRNIVMGIPEIDSPKHSEFSRQVKLEPFKRAMQELKPDVWFTNLRSGQTALRDSLDIFSLSSDGVLKVSPFYYYDDLKLNTYLKENNLPNESDYYDPTKVLAHRECGIHL